MTGRLQRLFKPKRSMQKNGPACSVILIWANDKQRVHLCANGAGSPRSALRLWRETHVRRKRGPQPWACPPHGGTLTELGEHAFNVEWVRDAGQGSLDAYILDGHAENFVRLPLPAFSITLEGQPTALALAAVASPQTGETVGSTSHFRAQSDAIKGTNRISGEIKGLEIRGQVFDGVKFFVP